MKSRQRVDYHGEVFTAEREVQAMLDLVQQEIERIHSRFLEPACGTGNFLVEVVKDFDTLVSIDVFNSALMNDAVYKFKRYEDASLDYAGINRHAGAGTGLWDTTLGPGEL